MQLGWCDSQKKFISPLKGWQNRPDDVIVIETAVTVWGYIFEPCTGYRKLQKSVKTLNSFIIIPLRMIKILHLPCIHPPTHPPIKTAVATPRASDVPMCMYTHRLLLDHTCISVRVMTVCVSVRDLEGGDSPHCLRHQPTSPGAGLKAEEPLWAQGPQLWLDDGLNRCLPHR